MCAAAVDSSRQALLQAAEKLFCAKGYQEVSTRELAEAAGVNLGAIQYHFGSKANLFIETVHNLMESSPEVYNRLKACEEITDSKEAAIALSSYLAWYLPYLLTSDKPQGCRLMFREVLSGTRTEEELFEPLLNSVVEKYFAPFEKAMVCVVGVINPTLAEDDTVCFARSIFGQCGFYVLHQPFIERISGKSLSEPEYLSMIVGNIITFTLRALRCEDATIEEARRSAIAGEPTLHGELHRS